MCGSEVKMFQKLLTVLVPAKFVPPTAIQGAKKYAFRRAVGRLELLDVLFRDIDTSTNANAA